jgi:hypothetical protein
VTKKAAASTKSAAKKAVSAKTPAGKTASKRATAARARAESDAQASVAAPDTRGLDAQMTPPPAPPSGAEAMA